MNCDNCDYEIVVRGLKELEYVHAHGGIFCMTSNVAMVNGLIKPMSDPEILAERAKKWLGALGTSKDAFDKASGWSTDSWRIVVNDSYVNDGKIYDFGFPMDIKHIFGALVILAKEAGVEL